MSVTKLQCGLRITHAFLRAIEQLNCRVCKHVCDKVCNVECVKTSVLLRGASLHVIECHGNIEECSLPGSWINHVSHSPGIWSVNKST